MTLTSSINSKIVELKSRNRRVVEEMEAHPVNAPLDGGGDGPQTPGMEARLAKLEAIAESQDRRMALLEQDIREVRRDLRGDFRLTWGGLFAVALGLAAMMAKGFHWIG